MQQNELAKLLGISAAMVSRLAKRGMPTGTLERAQRWRKRHLEPGRIKGTRFDPTQATKSAAPTVPAAAAGLADLLADVEAAGLELHNALTQGDQAWIDVMTQQVRDLLRALPDDANPALPLRVWEALTVEVQALLPPKDGNPVCADGSPIYGESLTAEEAETMGRFWLEVAAGKWTVKPDWRPPTP